MKKFTWITLLFAATSASAQPRQWIVGGNLGVNAGAFNTGATMDAGSDTGSPGASFFFQTEKKENNVITVNQLIAFGAHVKVNLYESNNWIVDLRPGAHLSIIDDVATRSGSDDKTVFGPSFRAGVAYRFTQQFELGVERLEFWNWFDDEAPANSDYTSLVFRVRF